jgi:hypothetical protein
MRKVGLICFEVSLLLFLVALFTPLSFSHIWLRNFILAVLFLSSFFAYNYYGESLKNKFLRFLIKYLPSLLILISLILILITYPLVRFLPLLFTQKWETVSISYRNKKYTEAYVAHQWSDVGALGYRKREVMIFPLTSLFEWRTEVDENTLDSNWMYVNEQYNPFGWK